MSVDARRDSQKGAGHGEKLSRRRESAIAALLSFPTIQDAAKHCNLHESTLRRWLKQPGFAQDFDRARGKALEIAQEQLRLGTISAVSVLLTIANDRKAPSAARVTAARSVLESTGMLKNQNVTVTNVIPQTIEGVDAAVEHELRSNPEMRAWVKSLIHKLEIEERQNTLAN